jgi:hypothetical protein
MRWVAQPTRRPSNAPAGYAPDSAVWLAKALAAAAVLAVVLLASGAVVAQSRKQQTIVPEDKLENLDVTKFSRPTEITNEWLPMKPGTRFVYDGMTVEDDGKVVPHQIIINIVDLVKVVGGVLTRVSYNLDYTEGELEEAALTFFAQDDDGNVWRFGKYLEEYDGRKVAKVIAWMHGLEDARAGIAMKREPQSGTPSYAQGYGPAVNWASRGQVRAVGQEILVGTTRYTNVLVIDETSTDDEPVNAVEQKFYAAGVGNIKAAWMGTGDKTREFFELTRVEQLDEQATAAVRAKAQALEKSAYRRSRNVYGRTMPAAIELSAGR